MRKDGSKPKSEKKIGAVKSVDIGKQEETQ